MFEIKEIFSYQSEYIVWYSYDTTLLKRRTSYRKQTLLSSLVLWLFRCDPCNWYLFEIRVKYGDSICSSIIVNVKYIVCFLHCYFFFGITKPGSCRLIFNAFYARTLWWYLTVRCHYRLDVSAFSNCILGINYSDILCDYFFKRTNVPIYLFIFPSQWDYI